MNLKARCGLESQRGSGSEEEFKDSDQARARAPDAGAYAGGVGEEGALPPALAVRE